MEKKGKETEREGGTEGKNMNKVVERVRKSRAPSDVSWGG